MYIATICTGDNSSRDNCASFVIILVCNRKFLSENDTFTHIVNEAQSMS